jgi:hypothetical protein
MTAPVALSREERRALWTLRLLKAAGLVQPIARLVDERLAELTADELEALREQWQARPGADR